MRYMKVEIVQESSYLILLKETKTFQPGSNWKLACSYSDDEEIHCCCEMQRIIIIITVTHHWLYPESA
jgi:hypothetical protein